MQWHAKFILSLAMITLLAGCWRGNSAGPGSGPAVEFDEGPNLVYTANGGEVHITPQPTGTVPADAIPKDLPIPHAATFSLISKSPQGVFATLHVATPPESVADFYSSQLTSDGWDAVTRQSGEMRVISAEKEERTLIVSITAAPPGSSVTMSYLHE